MRTDFFPWVSDRRMELPTARGGISLAGNRSLHRRTAGGASPKSANPRSVGVPPALGGQRAGRPRSRNDASLHFSERRTTAGLLFRAVLGSAWAVLALTPLAAADPQVSHVDSPPPARVYYTLDPRAVGMGKTPDAVIVAHMVSNLVREVTGKHNLAEAWLSLLKPTDVVGLKVSTGAGPIGGTHEAVARAVVAGLREAGFPRERIIIWDRNRADLLGNGFREDDPDYLLRWIDPKDGYDLTAKVTAPVLGRLIWGDGLFGQRDSLRFADLLSGGEQLSSQSHYAKVLSKEVTAVINIPSATDSFQTGIHGALATMTLSNLDNWRRFTKAPNYGDPYLAEIYADEMVGGKVVLTLLDALIVQYAGGPSPNPNYTVDNGTLFASRDPVAIDATLLAMVDQVRKASKLPSVKPMTGYLDSAQALGLGENMPARIETIRAGVGGYR